MMASRNGVLEAVTERPRELFDDLDLRDRATDLAQDVQKRSKDLRKRSQKAAKQTRELTAEAVDRAEDLRDRAEDLEPLMRKLAIDVLTAFRALIGVLMVIPRLVVRGLGIFQDLIDRSEVAREKGHELSERARDAAHAVPMSRGMRRRHRLWTALLVGGGFVVGFATGWILANRAREVREEEFPALLEPVGDPLQRVPEGQEGQEDPEARTGA